MGADKILKFMKFKGWVGILRCDEALNYGGRSIKLKQTDIKIYEALKFYPRIL